MMGGVIVPKARWVFYYLSAYSIIVAIYYVMKWAGMSGPWWAWIAVCVGWSFMADKWAEMMSGEREGRHR